MSDQEVGSLVLTSVFDRPPQALRSGEASDDVCFALSKNETPRSLGSSCSHPGGLRAPLPCHSMHSDHSTPS